MHFFSRKKKKKCNKKIYCKFERTNGILFSMINVPEYYEKKKNNKKMQMQQISSSNHYHGIRILAMQFS